MIGKKIESIQFQLLSPEIIRKMSTVRVVTPDTYDDDGFPIEAGLMDLRMGVIDPGLRCKTCGGRMATCPGHFGRIELVRPVVHIGYVKMVLTLLKATCRKCGRLLLPPEKIAEYKELLLKEESDTDETALEIIAKSKKVSKCPHCGAKQENIKLLKPTTFYEGDQRLFPNEIRERLERIPDKDLEIIGINPSTARPEWAILTVLPVPPVTARPSITLETGERSEDDLTHKLVDVLRINQRLADNISAGAPQLIIEDLWDLLQYHVTTYLNNEVSGIPPARHRSGRPLKTLAQRLKGKEGRFRYNLSGKRVNFSARTVISPDPTLSINEVGVPKAIAEELTIPIKVTSWNIEDVKQWIKNTEYPKANYVIRPDGRRKKITDLNREEILEEIEEGYTVERQLIDGDIVIFNRQPSLHRVSMMAHKVKVLPGKTFRLNDAASTPYNADYDGDEMNLHAIQNEEARAEAGALMLVEKHIVSIRHGNPLVTPNQDHVTGLYLLTRNNSWFTKEEAEYILSSIGEKKLPKPHENGMYHGRDIISLIIPSSISLEFENGLCLKKGECKKDKNSEAYTVIKNGKLKRGVLERKALKNILIKEMFEREGPSVTREFIDKATRLGLATLMIEGFSSSISDSDLDEDTKKKIKEILDEAEMKTEILIEKYKKGELERVPGKTLRESLEDLIMIELTKARIKVGRIVEKALGYGNHLVIMGRVSGRGSVINLTQTSGCIGQTALRGKRLLRGYRNKILPHFKEGDISARARGFIRSSFKDGLSPTEYFFHAMSGRDSLVDKGIRTAISGYMQRRLINALLDISLKADGTVRDSAGNLIQVKYGEDGISPMKCKGGKAIDIDKIIEETK
ncbi:DNA-directed RNA polymerase subunit A' [Candidatus Micrarchaeota archaeon]|nr:MAG: DNA-directed RNA polymerase subunit A' [Candidatus Micrarchaeota archaeon]